MQNNRKCEIKIIANTYINEISNLKYKYGMSRLSRMVMGFDM